MIEMKDMSHGVQILNLYMPDILTDVLHIFPHRVHVFLKKKE